jgi:hypothetical protein
MIIDIDDSISVQDAVGRISEDWFNPEEIYSVLKNNGKTYSSEFWGVTAHLLADVSGALGLTSEQFLFEWNQRCIRHDAKIMGYHCTRHSNKQVFTEKGILPLSEETIKLSDETNQTPKEKSMWEYRSQQTPGPWFLLSYKCAKSPNHFCRKGPEILLACPGHPAMSVPLIVHCAIPYSILSEKDYFAFCILRAYFNFLDPEGDLTNWFEGYSIDLKGKALGPQYVVRIEDASHHATSVCCG